MAICVCEYPKLVIDKRDLVEKLYLAMPTEVLKEEFPVPDLDIVEEEGFDKKKHSYMRVKFREPSSSPSEGSVNRYNVKDHIVIAGCPEDQLTCDTKNIYIVYHPIDEWSKEHMLELDQKE